MEFLISNPKCIQFWTKTYQLDKNFIYRHIFIFRKERLLFQFFQIKTRYNNNNNNNNILFQTKVVHIYIQVTSIGYTSKETIEGTDGETILYIYILDPHRHNFRFSTVNTFHETL